MRRHNYESFVGDVPLPRATNAAIQEIVRLAESYRRIALTRAELVSQQETIKPSLFERSVEAPTGPTESEVREALLALDAAVLRLYSLPARLERQLLDYFDGTSAAASAVSSVITSPPTSNLSCHSTNMSRPGTGVPRSMPLPGGLNRARLRWELRLFAPLLGPLGGDE